VDEALLVRGSQSTGNLYRDFEHFIVGNRASGKSVGERFPFEELHHQIIGAVFLSDVVKGTNVGMV